MAICRCGCGQETKDAASRYLRGHASRGRTLSSTTKQKISASLTGKKVPARGRSGTKNANSSSPECLYDRAWLQHEGETKTWSQVARELGVPRGTVAYAVSRLGLSKSRSEALKHAHNVQWPDGRNGTDAPNWKGGRRITSHGAPGHHYVYQYKPDHPNATKDGYVMEHRLVMEEKLGRLLSEDEVVHHKNGDKLDNRIENLELHDRASHMREHLTMSARLSNAEAELARYKEKFGDLEE